MKCPIDGATLETITYEGIRIERCPECGGIWLDADELGHIVEAREKRFTQGERDALAQAKPVFGVPVDELDRELVSPKSGTKLKPVNYGGDSGIIINVCPNGEGIWLDACELESIQALVEGWEQKLPEDLAKHRELLDKVEMKQDLEDDVSYSRFGVINAIVNGIIDKVIMR